MQNEVEMLKHWNLQHNRNLTKGELFPINSGALQFRETGQNKLAFLTLTTSQKFEKEHLYFETEPRNKFATLDPNRLFSTQQAEPR